MTVRQKALPEVVDYFNKIMDDPIVNDDDSEIGNDNYEM